MKPTDITVLILTLNEAPNLPRSLERLAWASRIIILDSFSSDETQSIALKHPKVRLLQRPFDNHTAQWNHGLQQVSTPWVLSLDADYILPDEFAKELAALEPAPDTAAYAAGFRYCVYGRPLRGTLYPNRPVLFRNAACTLYQDGHTQRLKIAGKTGLLHSRIDHDDRKPLTHWLAAQDKYAALEAEKLLTCPSQALRVQDRLRRLMLPAPFVVLVYTLFIKGTMLDGWSGWLYAFQRLVAELMLSLRLLDLRLMKLPRPIPAQTDSGFANNQRSS
jgi:glycosyltransferase involved in cell wall biosynthesis